MTLGIFRTNRWGLATPNLAELELAKRNQDSIEGTATNNDTPSPLGNVITIDDERIKSHLDRTVRGRVKETLDAEADRCAMRSAASAARSAVIPAPVTTSAICR